MTTRRSLLVLGGGLALSAGAAVIPAQADVGSVSTEGQVPDTSPNTIIAASENDRDASDYTSYQIQVYDARRKAWYDYGRPLLSETSARHALIEIRAVNPDIKYRAVVSTSQLLDA